MLQTKLSISPSQKKKKKEKMFGLTSTLKNFSLITILEPEEVSVWRREGDLQGGGSKFY